MTDTAARPTDQSRWGAGDERGALNLLDPETVLAATRACRTGVVYNLGLPVQRSGVPVFDYRGAPQRLTLTGAGELGAFTDFGAPPDLGANEDTLVIPAHNGTHMDALSHVFADGVMYNGFPASSLDPVRTNSWRISRRAASSARARRGSHSRRRICERNCSEPMSSRIDSVARSGSALRAVFDDSAQNA
jgi:hypothetical protein